MHPDGSLDVDGEFTLTCGVDDKAVLEVIKWFDTNRHYLVPKIGLYTPVRPVASSWLSRAVAGGEAGRPVLVGPAAYLLGAKPAGDVPVRFDPPDRLNDALAVFEAFLVQLVEAGVDRMQLDEPGSVCDTWALPRIDVLAAVARAYDFLRRLPQRPVLFTNTLYGDLGSDGRETLAGTLIGAIDLDLVIGRVPATENLVWSGGKAVVAGTISGRNIWHTNFTATLEGLHRVQTVCSRVAVFTSASLQYIPHDVAVEATIDPGVHSRLVFADQEIAEI